MNLGGISENAMLAQRGWSFTINTGIDPVQLK